LLNELEARGVQVNWGTTGFSARWRCPDGSRVTLGYGIVSGYYGAKQSEPIFEVYFGQIPNEEDANWLRDELNRRGYYFQHGDGAYHLQLESAPSKNPRQLLEPVFQLGEHLAKSG